MFKKIRDWFRPRVQEQPGRPKLKEGEQYVDETPSGKLYLEMQKHCPDCGYKPPAYFEGPSGGLSTNVFCSHCGQGYNITPMVEIAERIHRDLSYIKPEKRNDHSQTIGRRNGAWRGSTGEGS